MGSNEGFSFSHCFDSDRSIPDGAVNLSQSSFDAMVQLTLGRGAGSEATCARGPADPGPKLENCGAIASLQLPDGFKQSESDASGPQEFRSGNARIGVYEQDLSKRYIAADGDAVLRQPGHKLSDDEYFKIANMMSPGPWSPDGRGHEIGLQTQEVNGKKVVVYDFWRKADPRQDSFEATSQPNDLRTRVYFVPNDKTHKVDVVWFEAKNSEFDKAAKEFDQSLKTVQWK